MIDAAIRIFTVAVIIGTVALTGLLLLWAYTVYLDLVHMIRKKRSRNA